MSEYVYYVCNEFGDIVYEYYTEMDAREQANKQEGYSISKRRIVNEDA
jgi:hypothetical protein